MYRTDHAHRWERTSYEPMSAAYARTLYDDSAIVMTGDTRPAEFGHTRSGEEVYVKRSGFGVDIDTDSIPLDQLDARLLEPWHLPHMGHRPNDAAHEQEAARIAGARMGGGDLAPSEPMPLAVSRKTPQHFWSDAANYVVAALAVGCVIGWALGKLA